LVCRIFPKRIRQIFPLQDWTNRKKRFCSNLQKMGISREPLDSSLGKSYTCFVKTPVLNGFSGKMHVDYSTPSVQYALPAHQRDGRAFGGAACPEGSVSADHRWFCPGKRAEQKEFVMLKLTMDPAVAQKMGEDLIGEEDLSQVIETCEKQARYLIDQEADCRICHLKIGYTTYWVHYRHNPGGSVAVLHAYTHRMDIQEEYRDES
jgi:hypothetical protein